MECNELVWLVIGKKLFVVSMWIVLFVKMNDIILSCFNVWSLEIDSKSTSKKLCNCFMWLDIMKNMNHNIVSSHEVNPKLEVKC
jgi:hypothetical protein